MALKSKLRFELSFTCIKNSILSSSTSSAKWFLIFEAGSRLKCWSVNFSCRGRLKDFWSQLKASLKYCQVTFLPFIIRHRGLPLALLFSILFLIFFMLCWEKKNKLICIRTTVHVNVILKVQPHCNKPLYKLNKPSKGHTFPKWGKM